MITPFGGVNAVRYRVRTRKAVGAQHAAPLQPVDRVPPDDLFIRQRISHLQLRGPAGDAHAGAISAAREAL